MSVTNEPAPHAKPWDVEWQQFLARQQNNASLTQIIGDGSNLEGDLTTVEGVVAALVVAVGKLNTVVNTTSESSDYALSVNETAQIDITAASTPLNIAVEDGWYQIKILFNVSTFGANSGFSIEANNAADVGAFARANLTGSTTFATDEIDMSIVAVDGHVEYNVTGKPVSITANLTILGAISHMDGIVSFLDSAGNPALTIINTTWDTAHTSLGTIVVSEVCTGVAYVKRTA